MNSNGNWTQIVEDTLQHVYPDRWSLTEPDRINTSYYSYFVHFPIIEIRNSEGRTHTIKDLYIRLRFKETGHLYDIEGNRATYNQAEIESKYAHSHLSSTVVENGIWGGFCMGDEPIVADIEEIRVDGVLNNQDLFEAVLYQLEIFLAWESLEGGPYRHMKNIQRRKSMVSVPHDEVNDAYNRFISKYTNVNFTIQEYPPMLKIDPYDEEFMDQVLPLIKDEYKVFRDSTTGEFFGKGSTQAYPDKDLRFKFKGEQILRKVLNEEEGEQNTKRYPHPEFLRGISERLERKLTLHAFSRRERNERETDSCIIGGVMVQSI